MLFCYPLLTVASNFFIGSFSIANHFDIHVTYYASGLSFVTIGRSSNFGPTSLALITDRHCLAEAHGARTSSSTTANRRVTDERNPSERELTTPAFFSIHHVSESGPPWSCPKISPNGIMNVDCAALTWSCQKTVFSRLLRKLGFQVFCYNMTSQFRRQPGFTRQVTNRCYWPPSRHTHFDVRSQIASFWSWGPNRQELMHFPSLLDFQFSHLQRISSCTSRLSRPDKQNL